MEKYGGISVSFQIWPFTTSLDSDGSNTPSAWPPSRAHALGPLVVSFMWEGLENNDKFWSERLQKALTSIKDAAHEAPYTDADAAPPVYPSLTSETTAQEVYGVNLNKLVDIRTRYDPDGNMSRGSGFKINNAKEEEAERARILLKRYDTIIIVSSPQVFPSGHLLIILSRSTTHRLWVLEKDGPTRNKPSKKLPRVLQSTIRTGSTYSFSMLQMPT